MDEISANALLLINHKSSGVLSTHSLEMPGYPFGSLTPYACDELFRPILLISDLAQHTKNIKEDPKVSLTVLDEASSGEHQAFGRLTFLGEVEKIGKEHDDYQKSKDSYFQLFPYASEYLKAHGFDFYRINPKRIRFIGGFGKIAWIEQEQWSMANPFDNETKQRIISHMNEDHQHNLKDYLTFYKNRNLNSDEEAIMVNIYQFGFHILVNKDLYHFPFKTPVKDANEAREQLVQMAKESKK